MVPKRRFDWQIYNLAVNDPSPAGQVLQTVKTFLMAHIRLTTLLLLLFIMVSPQIGAQGFLHVSGKQIVNEKGQAILLRGVGLGGWMLQEGYMLQVNGQGMQHAIKARIADLIGEDSTNAFYDA